MNKQFLYGIPYNASAGDFQGAPNPADAVRSANNHWGQQTALTGREVDLAGFLNQATLISDATPTDNTLYNAYASAIANIESFGFEIKWVSFARGQLSKLTVQGIHTDVKDGEELHYSPVPVVINAFENDKAGSGRLLPIIMYEGAGMFFSSPGNFVADIQSQLIADGQVVSNPSPFLPAATLSENEANFKAMAEPDPDADKTLAQMIDSAAGA